MRFKSILAVLTAIGVVALASALWSPANAMGPVGPSAGSKVDNSLVEKVHRRWRRGYYGYRGYYPRYGYRYQPYYGSYYGYGGYPYYYRPYRPYYGGWYGPRVYGWGGFYGPRFGLRIGW